MLTHGLPHSSPGVFKSIPLGCFFLRKRLAFLNWDMNHPSKPYVHHPRCNRVNNKGLPLPKTNSKSTWKWMIGKRSFHFWGPAYFQGRTVSFREGNPYEQRSKPLWHSIILIGSQGSLYWLATISIYVGSIILYIKQPTRVNWTLLMYPNTSGAHYL